MTELRFETVGTEASRLDWQRIHNVVVPTSPLSPDEIAERLTRNHLEVAYLDGTAVGNSTVRPPTDGAATVIARVLPEFRRRGFGSQIYQRALAEAHDLGAKVVDTVVLASNVDGLQFAVKHGFVEVERYLLPGGTVPFVDLRLG